MPYRWVRPRLFYRYKNKRIYNAYDDGWENDPMTCWYNTDPLEESEDFWFDIRDIYGLVKDDPDFIKQSKNMKLHSVVADKLIMLYGIRKKLIKFPEGR
jgi:hypothetical protein